MWPGQGLRVLAWRSLEALAAAVLGAAHAPFASRLDLVEPEHAIDRAQAQRALGEDDDTWLDRDLLPQHGRSPDLQARVVVLEERARPGLVGTHLALQLGRRTCWVEPAVLASQQAREGRSLRGLRHGLEPAVEPAPR